MGDPRRSDLALLFSLAAIPMAGCPTGVEDSNASTFNPTVGGSNPTVTDAGDDGSEGDGSEDGGDQGSASGPGITTMTTAGDETGGDPSSASITNPSTDPTSASVTYGGTYGGTYGATYGSSGYGTGYGTGYGMLPPVCEQYVSNYIDCVPMAAGYAEEIANFCAGELMYASMVGGACGSAIEEYFACMSTADCGEIGGADPCYGSEVESVCGGG
ncbi:MAG: hypothetical protein IAG13_37990 [Deltaproteobacteria bacterium]|nr:hypothetical protein [Nannocystaceae bacterium]